MQDRRYPTFVPEERAKFFKKAWRGTDTNFSVSVVLFIKRAYSLLQVSLVSLFNAFLIEAITSVWFGGRLELKCEIESE